MHNTQDILLDTQQKHDIIPQRFYLNLECMMTQYVKTPVELGIPTDCQGIYVETTEARIRAMLSDGHLEFGVGDTRADSEHSTIASRMRGHESSKNLSWQHYLLYVIPTPGYRDYLLHKIIRQTFAVQLQDPNTGTRNEVFRVKVDQTLLQQFKNTGDFEPIRGWLTENIQQCAAKLNPLHKKQSVLLRNIQTQIINQVTADIRQNGLATNFVCELAPRVGKTVLFLSLAKKIQQLWGHQSMFIMAYGVGLSVKTSYQNEISRYIDFANQQFIDAADIQAQQQYQQACLDGKMPVVFISLNPQAEQRYEWIKQLSHTHIALLEETDFGSHTDSQVEKVEYILSGKTITRFNASGTNSGRLAKAFGKNAIHRILSVPYCMVEQDHSIPNRVIRRFYNMLFNPNMNKLLEDFESDVLPTLNKILENAWAQEKFIAALFKDLLGYQPIYGMNLSQAAGEIINHLMLFVNISKKSMQALAEIIEKHCDEHKVLILNGDHTDNKQAEALTREALVRVQNGFYPGRDKLLVITNMMGTRSYSIAEIQACVFMQDGGDVYPYMQKYSRCLTPGEGKKFGHIFDFAFDPSKTRLSIMSVAVEAALLIRKQNNTYPEAVRQVLNSVNIRDMVSGQWIDAEQVILQFEDNNKLLEIANAHTRISIADLTAEEISAFAELAKRSTGSKAEKSNIDKTIATGKTFLPGKPATGCAKKNPCKVIVEKAIRMINASATTVLALCNYQADSFLECIVIIDADSKMRAEFLELYGVYPDTFLRLANRLEISTLDIIVKMSKYNNKQKHIENNALSILKDDPKLWFEIFGHGELKSFITGQRCQSILVVAGGHGSEIDVLVNLFGIEIVDKIVYNDKYSFLCNQIKRKYPAITVVPGDFTELEFDMKFDVIVGNPPFKELANNGRQTNKSTWKNFLLKTDELAKDGGFIAMITPTGWCAPSDNGKLVDKFFTKNNLIFSDISTSVAKAFPNISSTFGYTITKKEPYLNHTTIYTDDGAVTVDLTKTRLITNKGLSIIMKLTNSQYPRCNFKLGGVGVEYSGDGFHTDNKPPNAIYKNIHAVNSSKDYLANTTIPVRWSVDKSAVAHRKKVVIPYNGPANVIVDNGEYGVGWCQVLLLPDTVDTENARTVFNSKLFRYFVKQKHTQYNENKNLNQFPLLPLDKSYTDAELYSIFGLSQAEIDYIESNVK